MEQTINKQEQDINNSRDLKAVEYWANCCCREKNEIMKEVGKKDWEFLNKSMKDAYREIIKYIMENLI